MNYITTQVQLENIIQDKIKIAVSNVAKTMADNLEEIIFSEYYAQYDPKSYKRTGQFWDSVVYNMLNDSTGEIFVDYEGLKYKDATGLEVVTFASMGFHGNYAIETEGQFWKTFIEFANANVRDLLKAELRKQGLNVV